MDKLKIPKTDTAVDRIIAFKKNADVMVLTKDDQVMMDRADYAENLIRNDLHKSDHDIAKRIVKQFKVSLVTAYKDIMNAKFIHGATKKYQKDYWIYFLIEHGRKALGMAYKNKDTRNILQAIHELGLIVKLMPDESKDPLDKIQKHSYFLIIKNEKGASLKIDLNRADRLSSEEVIAIEQTMETDFRQQTIDIMHEQLASGS